MPPAKKGNQSAPTTTKAKRPPAKAVDNREVQPEVPSNPLRVYCVDLVPLDGGGSPVRAIVQARDEDGAREALDTVAANYDIRNIWSASEKPCVLALVEPQHLL